MFNLVYNSGVYFQKFFALIFKKLICQSIAKQLSFNLIHKFRITNFFKTQKLHSISKLIKNQLLQFFTHYRKTAWKRNAPTQNSAKDRFAKISASNSRTSAKLEEIQHSRSKLFSGVKLPVS
jgi:tRNA isopentenyl-2-thiomethyl-A-37 hydroxylase MiaE